MPSSAVSETDVRLKTSTLSARQFASVPHAHLMVRLASSGLFWACAPSISTLLGTLGDQSFWHGWLDDAS